MPANHRGALGVSHLAGHSFNDVDEVVVQVTFAGVGNIAVAVGVHHLRCGAANLFLKLRENGHAPRHADTR